MKEKTIKFWVEHFQRQKESGTTQKRYCSENSISYKYFANMKAKIKKLSLEADHGFVEIPVKLKKDYITSESIELIIKGKYKIKVHSGFDQNTFKKVLETIEG